MPEQKFITTKGGKVIPVNEAKGGASKPQKTATAASLSPAQLKALRAYKVHSDLVQGVLQGSKSKVKNGTEYVPNLKGFEEAAKTKDEARQHAEEISSAIRSQRLVAPMQVHRGVFLGSKDPNTLVGRSYSEKGFLSTSADERVARRYLSAHSTGNTMTQGYANRSKFKAVLTLHLPAGHSAIHMESTVGEGPHGGNENEMLLDRGGKYRVEKVEPLDWKEGERYEPNSYRVHLVPA